MPKHDGKIVRARVGPASGRGSSRGSPARPRPDPSRPDRGSLRPPSTAPPTRRHRRKANPDRCRSSPAAEWEAAYHGR